MPYYSMHCQKAECQHSADILMKYDEMTAGVACPQCNGEMLNKICPSIIKGTSSDRYIMAPDVGPMSKKSRAYEKKIDDENSTFYAPDHTFGAGGVKGFKSREVKKQEMEDGKQNFTKD